VHGARTGTRLVSAWVGRQFRRILGEAGPLGRRWSALSRPTIANRLFVRLAEWYYRNHP
jgi:hypothetical protein